MKIYRPEMSYIRYSTKLKDITENPKRYYLRHRFRANMLIKASHIYQNKAGQKSWNQMYQHEEFIHEVKQQIEYHHYMLDLKYKEKNIFTKIYTKKTQKEMEEDALAREKADLEFDEKWADYWEYYRNKDINDSL